MSGYKVANALGEAMKEIIIPEAREADKVADIEKRDHLIDQAERVLDRIIDSMPADPRPKR